MRALKISQSYAISLIVMGRVMKRILYPHPRTSYTLLPYFASLGFIYKCPFNSPKFSALICLFASGRAY